MNKSSDFQLYHGAILQQGDTKRTEEGTSERGLVTYMEQSQRADLETVGTIKLRVPWNNIPDFSDFPFETHLSGKDPGSVILFSKG